MSTHDGLSDQALRILEATGRQPFRFQADVAAACLDAVRDDGRLLVLAPTGSGKTLISHLLICLVARSLPDRFPRIFVVVPSRGLLSQQYTDASWLRRQELAIHYLDSGVPQEIYQSILNSFGVIYTTPITLTNRLRQIGADGSDEILSKVDCVIFDEIDTYLTVDELKEREDTWNALERFLHVKKPVIGFTGTSLSKKQLARWRGYGFGELPADVPGGWLPSTIVNFRGVFDQGIKGADDQIRLDLKVAYRKLVDDVGQVTWSKIKEWARSDHPAAKEILGLCAQRLQVFETLTPAKREVLLESCTGAGPTLVLSRFIGSADHIRSLLKERGVDVREAHGEMTAERIHRATYDFRRMAEDQSGVLVITRELGGRGLDFPNAQRAHVISPRSNYQAVAQEIARIRSRRSAPKTVTITYYAGTEEEYKARRLGGFLKRLKFGQYNLFQTTGLPREPFGIDYGPVESMVSRYEEYVHPIQGLDSTELRSRR